MPTVNKIVIHKAVVFCKVGLRTLLPEISENLDKNKNEIPGFFIPSDPRKGSGFYYYHYWCTCTRTLET